MIKLMVFIHSVNLCFFFFGIFVLPTTFSAQAGIVEKLKILIKRTAMASHYGIGKYLLKIDFLVISV